MSYVFQAYPMRITSPTGQRIRVLSEKEHDALLAEWTKPDEVAPLAATSFKEDAPTAAVNPLLTDTAGAAGGSDITVTASGSAGSSWLVSKAGK